MQVLEKLDAWPAFAARFVGFFCSAAALSAAFTIFASEKEQHDADALQLVATSRCNVDCCMMLMQAMALPMQESRLL